MKLIFLSLSLLLTSLLSAQIQINPDSIQIARDRYGVPHIFAETDPEVAYGLAWAHAEDDFKNIQLNLLAAKGMLGEVEGKDGAIFDWFLKFMRIRETVDEKFETDLSKDFIKVLEGYSAGLNAYAESYPNEVLLKKSFPLTPKDIISGYTLIMSLFSGVPDVIPLAMNDKLESYKKGFSIPLGSNGLAISGKKTADKKSYLAINSHQPLEGRFAWYEAHVCSEMGWNMLGGVFPGGVSLFVGSNPSLGWTHTFNRGDFVDFYKLTTDKNKPNQYFYDGKWLELEKNDIPLKVKVGPLKIKVKRKAWWSQYGPVIESKKGVKYAFAITGNSEIRVAEQWYRMNRARDLDEFKTALQMHAATLFNVIYADVDQNVMYAYLAKIPFRDKKFTWNTVVQGDTSATKHDWIHPLEDLPMVLNPKSGYVFNTNNTPFNCTRAAENLDSTTFDVTMGLETKDNNRSVRMSELLNQYDEFSYEDFKQIKYDLQYPDSSAFMKSLQFFWKLKPIDYPDLSETIIHLQLWDKKGNKENQHAAVPFLVIRYLFDLVKGGSHEAENGIVYDSTQAIAALYYAKNYLLKHFGKQTIRWGDLMRHVRGRKNLPMNGMPDLIAAMYGKEHKNGRLHTYIGESYIQLVKFGPGGPEIESVHAYGASSKENSRHYTDQMKLFIKQETKKMSIDKFEILQNAERVYQPKVNKKFID